MNNAQEKEEILVGEGIIMVDSRHMERKVDVELKKIIDEQMRPFELLVQKNKQLFYIFIILAHVMSGLIFGALEITNISGKLVELVFCHLGFCFLVTLPVSLDYHRYSNKKIRFESFLKKTAKCLKFHSVAGESDVSKLSDILKIRLCRREAAIERFKKILLAKSRAKKKNFLKKLLIKRYAAIRYKSRIADRKSAEEQEMMRKAEQSKF